jgi:hypothetical protein
MKIMAEDPSRNEYINAIHGKHIRDIKVCPLTHDMVVTTSWDRKLNVTDAHRSKTVVQRYGGLIILYHTMTSM